MYVLEVRQDLSDYKLSVYIFKKSRISNSLEIEIFLKNLCSRMRHQTGATRVSLYSYCFPGRRVSEGNALFVSCQNEIPKMFHVNVSQKCHRALIEYIAFAFALREMLTFTSGRLEFSAHSDILCILRGTLRCLELYRSIPILIKSNCLMTVNKKLQFFIRFLFRDCDIFCRVMYLVYRVSCVSNSQFVFDTRE